MALNWILGKLVDLINWIVDREERKALKRDIPSPSAQGRADAPSVSMTTYIIRPGVSTNERVARRAYMAEVEEMMQDISWRYAEREGA